MDEANPICTIGYGSRSIDEFVATLLEFEAEYVVDVRSAPYSRFKPEFSRETLSPALERHEVRYVFMGDTLGGKPDDRACYGPEGRVDYERCRLRPAFQQALASLEAGWEAGHRIVLMCSEGKPEECHRAKLVSAELVAIGVPVVHIDERGELRPHNVIMNLITAGQHTIFGEHASLSRSRGRYQVTS